MQSIDDMDQVGTVAGVAADVENMKVNMDDFLAALQEVPPAFGVSETELQQCVQNHIIPFAPNIEVTLVSKSIVAVYLKGFIVPNSKS